MFKNDIIIQGGPFTNPTMLSGILSKKMNIVYGRNGSGKSTIARAFREQQASLPQRPVERKFQLSFDQSGIFSPEVQGHLFVFNEDFILDSVRFPGGGLKSIIRIGASAQLDAPIQEAKDKIKELDKDLKRIQDQIDTLDGDSPESIAATEKALKDGLKSGYVERLDRIEARRHNLTGTTLTAVTEKTIPTDTAFSTKDADYKETYTLEDYQSDNEIPHAESIDKLTVQICLVLLVYFLVFLLMYGIQQLDLGQFGTKTLKPMVWGFNFLWGTLLGVLVKVIINRLRKNKLMQREYINNFTLDRLAGTCFDFMIVAGTAAIDFSNLRGLWLPLILVCALGAVATFFYVRACSRYLYPDYPYEGFFSMFGMLTGTASNGMILLREIDPKFETPAANNLVLQTIPAIVFGFPVLLLMGLGPQSLNACLITFGILLAAFLIFALFIFRKAIFRKHRSNQ